MVSSLSIPNGGEAHTAEPTVPIEAPAAEPKQTWKKVEIVPTIEANKEFGLQGETVVTLAGVMERQFAFLQKIHTQDIVSVANGGVPLLEPWQVQVLEEINRERSRDAGTPLPEFFANFLQRGDHLAIALKLGEWELSALQSNFALNITEYASAEDKAFVPHVHEVTPGGSSDLPGIPVDKTNKIKRWFKQQWRTIRKKGPTSAQADQAKAQAGTTSAEIENQKREVNHRYQITEIGGTPPRLLSDAQRTYLNENYSHATDSVDEKSALYDRMEALTDARIDFYTATGINESQIVKSFVDPNGRMKNMSDINQGHMHIEQKAGFGFTFGPEGIKQQIEVATTEAATRTKKELHAAQKKQEADLALNQIDARVKLLDQPVTETQLDKDKREALDKYIATAQEEKSNIEALDTLNKEDGELNAEKTKLETDITTAAGPDAMRYIGRFSEPLSIAHDEGVIRFEEQQLEAAKLSKSTLENAAKLMYGEEIDYLIREKGKVETAIAKTPRGSTPDAALVAAQGQLNADITRLRAEKRVVDDQAKTAGQEVVRLMGDIAQKKFDLEAKKNTIATVQDKVDRHRAIDQQLLANADKRTQLTAKLPATIRTLADIDADIKAKTIERDSIGQEDQFRVLHREVYHSMTDVLGKLDEVYQRVNAAEQVNMHPDATSEYSTVAVIYAHIPPAYMRTLQIMFGPQVAWVGHEEEMRKAMQLVSPETWLQAYNTTIGTTGTTAAYTKYDRYLRGPQGALVTLDINGRVIDTLVKQLQEQAVKGTLGDVDPVKKDSLQKAAAAVPTTYANATLVTYNGHTYTMEALVDASLNKMYGWTEENTLTYELLKVLRASMPATADEYNNAKAVAREAINRKQKLVNH